MRLSERPGGRSAGHPDHFGAFRGVRSTFEVPEDRVHRKMLRFEEPAHLHRGEPRALHGQDGRVRHLPPAVDFLELVLLLSLIHI